MLFSVSHVTKYSYSEPVRLGPHLIRLSPRPEAGRLVGQEITVFPVPAARAEKVDLWGNRVLALDFAGETRAFRIESALRFATRAPEPAAAPAPDPAYLPNEPAAPEVARFAEGLRRAAGEGEAFAAALCEALYTRTDRQIRETGAAQSATETLITARGACRDITVLAIAAARAVGMPARFVSGYQAMAESPDGRRHLHAWVEIWVAGRGWMGFDATHGTAVGAGHLPLAVAPDQAATMPVEGSFWAGRVETALGYEIRIDTRA